MSAGTSAPPGQQASEGAQQKVQEVAGQAQEKAQAAAEQAKGKLREQLEQRSWHAAEQISQQASDLRAVGQSLREQGQEGPAGAAEKLAEYAQKVGGYLREKDSDALLADAEDFGRRQPWAVGAGALALGFAASRFLKASSSRRFSTRYGGQSPSRPASAQQAAAPTVPASSFTGSPGVAHAEPRTALAVPESDRPPAV